MNGKNSNLSYRMIGIFVCAAIIICCSAYMGWYTWHSHKNTQSRQEDVQKYVISPSEIISVQNEDEAVPEENIPKYNLSTIDFKALWKNTRDVKAWIQIPALDGVDFPICWNGDNFYYLDHSWDGVETAYGAIFLEENNDPDFTEPYQVIFGHAMRDGSMFAGLAKYTKQEFYEENGGTIFLYLPRETRVYEIFSAAYVNCFDSSVYTVGYGHDEQFGTIVSMMKRRSIYDTGIEVDRNDSIITLSTCAGGDNRVVLHAALVDTIINE